MLEKTSYLFRGVLLEMAEEMRAGLPVGDREGLKRAMHRRVDIL